MIDINNPYHRKTLQEWAEQHNINVENLSDEDLHGFVGTFAYYVETDLLTPEIKLKFFEQHKKRIEDEIFQLSFVAKTKEDLAYIKFLSDMIAIYNMRIWELEKRIGNKN